MPATCFAAPTILFAEPVLPAADAGEAGLKPCAAAITVRLKPDPTYLFS
jgi:hypothetical protein